MARVGAAREGNVGKDYRRDSRLGDGRRERPFDRSGGSTRGATATAAHATTTGLIGGRRGRWRWFTGLVVWCRSPRLRHLFAFEVRWELLRYAVVRGEAAGDGTVRRLRAFLAYHVQDVLLHGTLVVDMEVSWIEGRAKWVRSSSASQCKSVRVSASQCKPVLVPGVLVRRNNTHTCPVGGRGWGRGHGANVT